MTNVSVTLVESGDIRTEFHYDSAQVTEPMPEYMTIIHFDYVRPSK
ncbi:hypothetical protein [Enterococcus crotali]|nr:hypothetical protein [Enterococcus crotali]